MALAAGLVAAATGAAPAFADGAQWRPVAPALTDTVLYDVSSADGATWAVGIHIPEDAPFAPAALRWTGDAWVETPQPLAEARLDDIAVRSADEVWAVGSTQGASDLPIVQRWNGAAWEVVHQVPLPDGDFGGFSSVEVSPDGTVWATGWAYSETQGRTPLVLTGSADGGWKAHDLPAANGLDTAAVLPLADDDVYLAGYDGITHFDGETWSEQTLPGRFQDVVVADLAARGPDDVWAVGHLEDNRLWRRPVVLHFDGTEWRSVPTPAETGQLRGIAFDAEGAPVVVGETVDPAVDPSGEYVLTLTENGRFTHTEQVPGAGHLYGADTDDQGRVWAVGVTPYDATTPSTSNPYATIRD
ncbi:hypothetical protein [Allostreptomyces psammosilenae]|uniref:Uncharacterized protein n=1 Tax=Allostreptomyces psammosilenae TaxID=1892865 RepID=A0A852ZTC6_9ACTN|nr:hypothetical protein [Allostreptomyces psammosilenae]NYI05589.1 hypothetical protein [Allostreptomyces psammosilenae]